MATHNQNIVRSSFPGWCGLAALLSAYFFLQPKDLPTPTKAALLIGIVYIVLFIVEASMCVKGRFGLISAPSLRPLDFKRVFFKLAGWALTLFICSSPYWLFPEYSGSFYDPYYEALLISWPVLSAFFLFCIFWEDTRAEKAEDDYFLLGKALCTFNSKLLKTINLKQHALRWIVKIYFLPLMFVYLVHDLNFRAESTGVMRFYDGAYNFLFLIDTCFAATGYIFANNLIDTNIRSTEPTILGWACTLICYQPFFSVIGGDYLHFGSDWGAWLSNHPTLQIVWAVLILIALSLYIWATLSFGSRFSNLTHRGILACGPYAYLRHPAYIGKLASFLLMYIPFIGSDWFTVARNLILWSLLCGVYYLRAKTEESHLRSVGPEYDIYAKEVAQNWKKLWS